MALAAGTATGTSAQAGLDFAETGLVAVADAGLAAAFVGLFGLAGCAGLCLAVGLLLSGTFLEPLAVPGLDFGAACLAPAAAGGSPAKSVSLFLCKIPHCWV